MLQAPLLNKKTRLSAGLRMRHARSKNADVLSLFEPLLHPLGHDRNRVSDVRDTAPAVVMRKRAVEVHANPSVACAHPSASFARWSNWPANSGGSGKETSTHTPIIAPFSA